MERREDKDEEALLNIIREHENTSFGIEHNFKEITDYQSFCTLLKPEGYEKFRPYVERLKKGEVSALITEPAIAYTRSSGTTGHPKAFPKTLKGVKNSFSAFYPTYLSKLFLESEKEELQDEKEKIDAIFEDLSASEAAKGLDSLKLMNILRGKVLSIFTSSIIIKDEDGNEMGPVTGYCARRNGWFHENSPCLDVIHPVFWIQNSSSPPPIYFRSGNVALSLHLYFALLQRDIRAIILPFAATVCTLVELLLNNIKEIVSAMREQRLPRFEKTVLGSDSVDDEIWNQISDCIKHPDSQSFRTFLKHSYFQDHCLSNPNYYTERADEIERIVAECSQSNEHTHLLSKLWPNLKVLSTNCGGSMGVYFPTISKLVNPDNTTIFGAIYGASEGMFGYPITHNTYRLFSGRRGVFLEFLDQSGNDDDIALNMNKYIKRLHQVEAGKNYEIIITTDDGLYRYRVGDYVKCVSIDHDGPLFTIQGRVSNVITLVSEKTTEEMIIWGILQLSSALRIPRFVDFTLYPDPQYRCYEFFIEVQDEYLENFNELNPVDFLESKLAEANFDYYRLRSANAELKCLRIFIVQPNTFKDFAEFLVSKGTSAIQLKIPRPLHEAHVPFFQERIMKRFVRDV